MTNKAQVNEQRLMELRNRILLQVNQRQHISLLLTAVDRSHHAERMGERLAHSFGGQGIKVLLLAESAMEQSETPTPETVESAPILTQVTQTEYTGVDAVSVNRLEETLTTQAFANEFEQLKKQYDLVIIDMENATSIDSILYMAAMSDYIGIDVEYRRTAKRELESFLAKLHEFASGQIFAIYTGLPSRRQNYDY